MPDAQVAILEILTASGHPMRGLDIVKASNGRVGRGIVYVHLQLLEDAGWVLSREEPEIESHIGIARRVYWLRPGGPREPVPTGGLVPSLA